MNSSHRYDYFSTYTETSLGRVEVLASRFLFLSFMPKQEHLRSRDVNQVVIIVQ